MRFVAAFLSSLFIGCAGIKPSEPVKTIVPERVVDKQASWDGDQQNSGIIDYIDGKGFEVTKKALIRYNALIFLYGKSLVPPVVENHGVTFEGEKIFLSAEAMVDFMTLNQKFKNGR